MRTKCELQKGLARAIITGVLLIGILLTLSGVSCAQEAAERKRPVTVPDVIQMTQIGDRIYLDAYRTKGNVARLSPDGSKFAFVTQKADLTKNVVNFSLLVFKTADAFTSPAPEVVAVLASSSNGEAISKVSWLPDNDSLVFLGEGPAGKTPQLYKVSCTTKKVEQLTRHSTPIVAYTVSDKGDRFVYIAKAKLAPAASEETGQRGVWATASDWKDLYSLGRSENDTRSEIFIKTAAMDTPQRVGGIFDLNLEPILIDLQLSPNGRFALLRAFVNSPPTSWGGYTVEAMERKLTETCEPGQAGICPEQYLLIDLDHETIGPLMDAPIFQFSLGRIELAAWMADSNSVFLVNAFLPLAATSTAYGTNRRETLYAAEIAVPSRDIVEISGSKTPFPAFYIHPDAGSNRITTEPAPTYDGSPLEFRKRDGRWTMVALSAPAAEAPGKLSVTLDQDMNSPPKLVTSDQKTGRKSLLLDLNPQFVNLKLGRVEVFNWRTKDERTMKGLLYYPPDHVHGQRHPLVIQTHGFNPERFWIDGPYSTASAAQPLASRGFMVLQTDQGEDADGVLDTPKEGPREVASFEGAIDELDRRGLVDRTRVGLTGFSRTAYHVLYTITHSRYQFGAAVVADGVNFGYENCTSYSIESFYRLCETMNGGGPPYGDSLGGWVKFTPTFNLDKIGAPVMLQAISEPLGEWEIYSGLKWLKKPVEMINFYPEGAHILIKPWQRLTSQQATLDWYCFWLKGEEDQDPAKAGQYRRWRELRKLQQQNATKPLASSAPVN